mgnify:CR=1 FL=1
MDVLGDFPPHHYKEAVIYVYREARSLGLRGNGVVYMRHGAPPWRTSFRVERLPWGI